LVTKLFTLHDHNILFYASEKEKHRVLSSNLKTGLDMGCCGLYITREENIASTRVQLENRGLPIGDPKKITIVTSDQWYMPDGAINADRVMKQYRRLVDECLGRNFKGLYVSVDAAHMFDRLSNNLTPWLKYETSVGRRFGFPMEEICAYRTDQVASKSQVLLHLLQAHQNTILPNRANMIENKEWYIDALTEVYTNILGEKATEAIFHHLTTTLKMTRNQILDNIQGVDDALASLLGEGSSMLQQQVVKIIVRKLGL
jgi:hypothetical protein